MLAGSTTATRHQRLYCFGVSPAAACAPHPHNEVLYCIDLPPCLYVTQGHVHVRQECAVCKWDFEVESRALYNMPEGYCMFELHRHILSRHINDLDKAAR